MNRCRAWLGPLIALSASSPFWLREETGYASYRTELFSRWPMTGTPQSFASRAEYDDVIEALVAVGMITDASKIYWDVRPSSHAETLEFRVPDVCPTVDEAVMVAGLSRSSCRGPVSRSTAVTSPSPLLAPSCFVPPAGALPASGSMASSLTFMPGNPSRPTR